MIVHPFIYRGLRRSFLRVIRRSLLTGRGHIVSPRCQSVHRRTSRSHTGYQRFPIPQVQIAPIVRKACLTIVPQFIHSNQSSLVHHSLRNPYTRKWIVIRTNMYMTKTRKNMDSHSYKDVHDENPYKNIC